ncbi:MAG: DegT/DnrJ/EryC1/StrS family aminotransferase [Candidatus Zhuqueibacterota bacterium]
MIPHSKPSIDQTDIASVTRALSERRLSGGYYVEEFEAKLAGFFSLAGAVATNSGTTALHLALLGLNIGRGHEVAIPSYVCVSLLHALRYVGASPLLIDTDFESMNLDIHDLHRKVTPRTKAVIVPHLFGCPVEMEPIQSLDIPIIEDCAQSLGASRDGRLAGSCGALTVCSFYATKVIACGEGGMVCARSKSVTEKIRDLREVDEKENFMLRYNYKMSDIHASLGLSQFARLDEFIQTRKSLAAAYTEAFRDLPVALPKVPKNNSHIYYRYVIKVPIRADKIIIKMNAAGISCRRPIFKPLHHFVKTKACPITDTVYDQAISLPIYPGLTSDEQAYIVETFNKIVRETV